MVVTAERLAVLGVRPYLNPTQAAQLMGKREQTIYDAMSSGELAYIQQGARRVIGREDLDRWMGRGAPR